MKVNAKGKRWVSWEENKVGLKNFKWVACVLFNPKSDGLTRMTKLDQKNKEIDGLNGKIELARKINGSSLILGSLFSGASIFEAGEFYNCWSAF